MEPHAAIELHDASVEALRHEGEALVLELYGCLHASQGRPGVDAGSAYSLSSRLTFARGAVLERPSGEVLEFEVYDGALSLAGERFDNLVPLPLERSGATRLELSGAGGRLVLSGEGLRVEALGEPEDGSPFP